MREEESLLRAFAFEYVSRKRVILSGFRQLDTRRIERNLGHRSIRIPVIKLRAVFVYEMIDVLLAERLRLEHALRPDLHSCRVERNKERMIAECNSNRSTAFFRGHLHPAAFFLARSYDHAFDGDRLIGVPGRIF